MKLTAILLLTGLLTAHANGHAQTIRLSAKNARLEKLFSEIKQQSGFPVLYTRGMVEHAPLVSVNLQNVTLQQAMDEILKDQALTYSIVNNTIVIRDKLPEAPKVGSGKEETLNDIHGRVTDSLGNPMAGASVTVKGTKIGTQTDANGEFVLKGVGDGATLAVSFTGFNSREFRTRAGQALVIVLSRSSNPLDEIQVIAYGTTTRRFSTGNISTVKSEDIEKQPVSNPLQALEGRVPGLFITQATGYPGSGIAVKIQGINSISNGNDPLYVIDGVPYISQLLPDLGSVMGSSGGVQVNHTLVYGNPLSFINPADIESIEILKDADATAIYGSQAANGAVLITTKGGKRGSQKVDLNLQQGWGSVDRTLHLLNRRQYLDMRYEAFKNDGIPLSSLNQTGNYDLTVWDTTRSTDWQKELIGNTAEYTDLQGTVSGGGNNMDYLVGTGYHRETLPVPGNFADQKGSLHFQITSNSQNQRFKIQLRNSFVYNNNQLPNYNATDLAALALQLPPVAPPMYNPDGSINWQPNPAGKSTWNEGHPGSYLLHRYQNTTSNLISDLLLEYKIMAGLDFKTSFGFTDLQSRELLTVPFASIEPQYRATRTRVASYNNMTLDSWIIEPQITYQRPIGSGKFELLMGSSIQQRNSKAQALTGSGYINDNVLGDIHAASLIQSGTGYQIVYKYNGVFGRLNYTWNRRFIVNLTGRRDGSSRFGVENRFHNFGAVAGAWIFSEEKFMENLLPSLSFGKLKVSYGTTGNDQIGDYQYLSLYSPASAGNPYQGIGTLRVTGLTNPYLQWEETRKFSAGAELGFLHDRILANLTLYRNRSSNELLSYRLPNTTGFNSITENFPATVENYGWEMSLSATILNSKNLRWSASINGTVPKNELVSFPNLAKSSYANIFIVGKPVTMQRKFHLQGVDPATGAYFFQSKTNPSSPVYPDDATTIVNPAASWYGGFQNSFRYKSVEFDFLIQVVKQIGPNYSLGFLPGAAGINQPVYVLDRWQKPGDLTAHQRFNSNYSVSSQYYTAAQSSDGIYSDASYIRLKNVSLSWDLATGIARRLHLKQLRVYLQAQNLLTFTGYKGLDPETMSSASLPPLRVVTSGIQVTL